MAIVGFNRRRFIQVLATTIVSNNLYAINSSSPAKTLNHNFNNERLFATTAMGIGERYFYAVLNDSGQVVLLLRLPDRGHGIAYNKQFSHVAVFSRRPGYYLLIHETMESNWSQRISPPSGHHFNGHGVFSADEKYLFVTENNYQLQQGVIGVYDVTERYQRVAEFPSNGVGPHEIIRLNNANTLVVANGGIETHPKSGNEKLNVATMQPNLSYIDAHSGKLLDRFEPPPDLFQLSIRHLAKTDNDTVVVALQYEGKNHLMPLVATHSSGKGFVFFTAPQFVPEHILSQMRRYCGSVAIDNTTNIACVTAPKGGIATYWSIDSGKYIGSTHLVDSAGVAYFGRDFTKKFIITSGSGHIISSSLSDGERNDDSFQMQSNTTFNTNYLFMGNQLKWDNHIYPLSA